MKCDACGLVKGGEVGMDGCDCHVVLPCVRCTICHEEYTGTMEERCSVLATMDDAVEFALPMRWEGLPQGWRYAWQTEATMAVLS